MSAADEDFATREEAGPHPELCPSCRPWIEKSRLHWSLCGGLNVGMKKGRYHWRLFPDDSQSREEEKTKFLQRLAASARLVHELKSHVTDPEMLAKMERYMASLRGS